MEIRKVQITGGATFMITLPKKWARQVGLQSGSPLRIIAQPPDLLVLQPQKERLPRRALLDLEDKSGEILVRELIAIYIRGFELIEARGAPISAAQRQTVRETVQGRLMGMEIVEESSKAVTVQYLLDPAKLSVEGSLAKLLQNTRAMFQDGLRALGSGDRDTAHDVVARDIEADRLYLSLSRQAHIALQDILIAEQSGLERVQLFDAYTAAAQLERIADHAVKIAQITEQLAAPIPTTVGDQLKETGENASMLVQQAMDALAARSAPLAHSALDSGPNIEAQLYKLSELLHSLEPKRAQLLAVVLDSIGRVKDYGANIAETAINAAALSLSAG
ncbi:MAG TPA: phosphate uptake regulator PhoU [Candidatus Fraserbacteria bacterium]|nr:phosphate uptake regulator PhoU [Candidatus Fraserbacteria bacterium]